MTSPFNSLFCVSHYHKVQVFIQPLKILISANECKILSVCQYRQIHLQILTKLSKGSTDMNRYERSKGQ